MDDCSEISEVISIFPLTPLYFLTPHRILFRILEDVFLPAYIFRCAGVFCVTTGELVSPIALKDREPKLTADLFGVPRPWVVFHPSSFVNRAFFIASGTVQLTIGERWLHTFPSFFSFSFHG